MNSHFDSGLNVKEIILTVRPTLVVEAGVKTGAHTSKLCRLQRELPFDLICIDTGGRLAFLEGENVEWRRGVSYLLFPGLEDRSVGVAIIDTDHNYWTLMRELETIAPKMEKGGVICVHDTDTFRDSNGTMNAYPDGVTPYPRDEIMADDARGKKYGMAIPDFVDAHPEWKVTGVSTEDDGAVALMLT